MATKPPSISTNSPPAVASPRSRGLTFGSTSENAANRDLPKFGRTTSNGASGGKSGSELNEGIPLGPPTTLENLAYYLDWRNAKFNKDDINPDLWKIALSIWDFLPPSEPVFYTLNFGEATKHGVASNMKPPIRITSSLAGDLVYCFYSKKQYIDYDDTSTIIVFLPYIDSVSMKGVSFWETSFQERCTWWEIEHMTVTHIGLDKDDHIYFTNGEAVFRIMSLGGDAQYRQSWDEIWSVDGDTSHITSLWRQGDQLYFTTQDWEKEDHIDLYKVKYGKGGPGSTRSGPNSPASPGSRYRTGSFQTTKSPPGGSSSGHTTPRSPSHDSESSISKVRQFSLVFNQRVWQLTWLRYEKKFLLGIAACRGGTQPQLMQISFKKQLKLVPLGSKHYTWPRPYDDQIPHDFIYHRPTRTWLLFLPVFSTKTGKDPSKNKERFWIQFRLDANKKKVIWHRLVPLPEHLIEGEWLYYDEIRDVLIGWQCTDDKINNYKLKFLPDVSKLLWVDIKDDSKEEETIDSPSESNKNDNLKEKDKNNNAKSAQLGASISKDNKKGGKSSNRPKSARKPAKSAAAIGATTAKKDKDTKGNKKGAKVKKGASTKNVSKTEKKGKKDGKGANNAKANKTSKESNKNSGDSKEKETEEPPKKKDTIVDDDMD